ncbi:MAG: hypothetical protein J5704_00270 [Paludibacteraceae bacterium]|nr:hypothetical protein [Paludibacteraceae bacterium]
MKKLFSILAAALVAFSFASCEGQGGNGGGTVESNGFKISVDSITATSAFVAVEPLDTNATYYWNVISAEELAGLNDDSIIIYTQALVEFIIAYYSDYGFTWADLLDKGASSYTFTGLTPKTDYYVVAIYFDEEGKATEGKVGKKLFTTPELSVAGEVDFGTLPYGDFEDYRDYDGSFMAYGYSDTVEIGLNIYADEFAGNYTEEDLELYYSYVWTASMGASEVAIVKAELVGTENTANEEATIAGWALCENGIKYKFAFTYPTVESEEEEESAAAAPKKVKAAKKNITFKKHNVISFKK